MNICPNCGLPKEACICGELEKTKQKVRIQRATRKFGKHVTVVSGLDKNTKEIAKQLREKLACGGTVKDNRIELQGEPHKKSKRKTY